MEGNKLVEEEGKSQGEGSDWDLPQSAVNDFLRPSEDDGLFERNMDKSLPYSLDLSEAPPSSSSQLLADAANSESASFLASQQLNTNTAMMFYTGDTVAFEQSQKTTTTITNNAPRHHEDLGSSQEYEEETLPLARPVLPGGSPSATSLNHSLPGTEVEHSPSNPNLQDSPPETPTQIAMSSDFNDIGHEDSIQRAKPKDLSCGVEAPTDPNLLDIQMTEKTSEIQGSDDEPNVSSPTKFTSPNSSSQTQSNIQPSSAVSRKIQHKKPSGLSSSSDTEENSTSEEEFDEMDDNDFVHLSDTQEKNLSSPMMKRGKRLFRGVIKESKAQNLTQNEMEETLSSIREQERRLKLHKEKIHGDQEENILLARQVELLQENAALKRTLELRDSAVKDLMASLEKLKQKLLLATKKMKKSEEEIEVLTKIVKQKDEKIMLLKKLAAVSDLNRSNVQTSSLDHDRRHSVGSTTTSNKDSLKHSNKGFKKMQSSLVQGKTVAKSSAASERVSNRDRSNKKKSESTDGSHTDEASDVGSNASESTADGTDDESSATEGHLNMQRHWRTLSEHGWNYRTGPEPFNMVYVPPGGSTRRGARENVDFFVSEANVMSKAREMGHITDEFNETAVAAARQNNEPLGRCEPESYFEEIQHNLSNDDERNTDGSESSEYDEVNNDDAVDDNLLHGNLFTAKSLHQSARLIKKFCRKKSNNEQNFKSQLWKPIWNILYSQGSDATNLRWTYLKSTGLMSGSWIYGAPNSRGVRLGSEGTDYFCSEEHITVQLLTQIEQFNPSLLDQASIDKISHICSFFCDDNNDAENSKKRRRRQPSLKIRSPYQCRMPKRVRAKDKPESEVDDAAEAFTSNAHHLLSDANNANIGLSQSAVDGVQMLLEMKKPEEDNIASSEDEVGNKIPAALPSRSISLREQDTEESPVTRSVAANLIESTPNIDIGTDHGILKLVAFRADRSSNESKKNDSLRSGERNTARTAAYQFHTTQSPPTSVNNRNEGIRKEAKGCLSSEHSRTASCNILKGYSFIISGCGHVKKQVERMGGSVLEDFSEFSMERTDIGGKLWFLSEPSCRRRTKYILAVALGLPMLHFHCLDDLEQGNYSSLFDNELYKSWRLPTGLSIFSGLFVLQRARHACLWAPPGLENDGKVIFRDMVFMLALEDEEKLKDWTFILEAVGGCVLSGTQKRIDGAKEIDAVLVDSMLLSPQNTATPQKIEAALRSVEADVPILDLSWAVQSLIARRKLAFNEDGRFMRGPNVFSIKVKGRSGTEVRYEKGDTVKIRRSSKGDTCHARITDIDLVERMLSVEVLDPFGENALVDGGSCSVSLRIPERELVSHAILLPSKEYKGLKYADSDRDIFMLKTKRPKT